MKITIPIQARSKKNSQQIFWNKKTGRPFVTQSKLYKEFEQECSLYLKRYAMNIDYPIELKCVFYFKDKRKRDIVNYLNAIQDILVKYKVIADDNYKIVASVDGSRIIYDKSIEPKIEIEIKKIGE